MKFFKHFADAHRGASMQNLFEQMGHTGIACYWILVEMCAEKLDKAREEEFTEEHCKFTFHEKILRQNLRISRTNVELFLGFCAGFSLLSFEITESEIKIYMPKLLESMDRDAKRARPPRVQAAPKKKIKIKKKNKKEDKEEEKEVISTVVQKSTPMPSPESPDDLLKIISEKTQKTWATLYADPEFISRELIKAFSYYDNNPRKKPKSKRGWTAAINSWLERGWSWRAKSTQGVAGMPAPNFDDVQWDPS